MPIPSSLTCRDFECTPSIKLYVDEWIDKLVLVNPRVERCDVVVELPHQHQRHGRRYHVRVTVALPGPDVVASREPGRDGAHEDLYVALRDAFRATRRQLEERSRIARHEVKSRAVAG
jgi:ribosome-associated translation inhibitor RaiA